MGPILGAEFLVAVGDICAFESADRLAGYAGLVPAARDSGKRTGQSRRVRGGNKTLGSVDILNDMVDPASIRMPPRVGTVSSMAEVGLVRFARVALEVAEAVLPDYRTKFSKRTFTQPQLLAVLCLMRYEDWTLRKTEVRLAEHGELRSALGLRKAPDHTTLYRFLRRLDERALVAALNETVRCLPKKPDHHEQEPAAIVAVDATGLAPGAISTFYVRRTHNRGGEPMLWRRWLKWLVVVDTNRQMVLAQEACSLVPTTARRCARPLVDAAHEVTPLGVVLADSEFDSEHNHRHVRERLAAASVIPAKRGKAT